MNFRILFNRHFEWVALAAGLTLMALMNPYVDQGNSWCLFAWAGIGFCPGEGLGHSITFIFRGDFTNAMQANAIGFLSVPVLLGRISLLLNKNSNIQQIFTKNKTA